MKENIKSSNQAIGGSGFKCPNCQNIIVSTISIILAGGPIICTHCNLTLNLDINKSRESLDKLKEFSTKSSNIIKSNNQITDDKK